MRQFLGMFGIAIAAGEDESYALAPQPEGDRVAFLAMQVDIENGEIEHPCFGLVETFLE